MIALRPCGECRWFVRDQREEYATKGFCHYYPPRWVADGGSGCDDRVWLDDSTPQCSKFEAAADLLGGGA